MEKEGTEEIKTFQLLPHFFVPGYEILSSLRLYGKRQIAVLPPGRSTQWLAENSKLGCLHFSSECFLLHWFL